MTDTALAHAPAADRRRGEGLTAGMLIVPASIFVAFCLLAPLAILFRYSLNEFVTTKKVMVEAVTHYRVLAVLGDYSFVETQIDTGRKHQIRQHMAGIHHPLVLDPLYGDARRDRPFKKKFKYRKFFLHAQSLDFPHPVTGKMIHVEAPLPKAFDEALQKLRMRK